MDAEERDDSSSESSSMDSRAEILLVAIYLGVLSAGQIVWSMTRPCTYTIDMPAHTTTFGHEG